MMKKVKKCEILSCPFLERERTDIMYKSKSKKFFRFLITGVVFLVLLCTFNSLKVNANELFFDEDGNLYFHTRDKKALGKVRYLTLGWIIKRYDMPIDAPGQQYVIVQKRSYRSNDPDPYDDRYILSYFKSDRNEILDAVRTVSEDWYRILTGYGDDVYIDSVMTVCEGDKEFGVLYKNGTYEGEIYLTYDGISTARGWTNLTVNVLKNHYGMVLRFPQQVKKWDPYIDVINNEQIYIIAPKFAAFTMGAGSYGNEGYDITKGIPSGEKLYLKGVANRSHSLVSLKKITGRLTECVEVPINYQLQWVDYYGVKREETRTIYRYYPVTRDFTYYQYIGFDDYLLNKITFSSEIIGEVETIDIETPEINATSDIEVTAYGSCENHIVGYSKTNASNIGTVLLVGSNGKKPTIPDTDYSGIADEQVSDVRVRNDKVIIQGQQILKDDIYTKNTCPPASTFNVLTTDIYSEDICISKELENGLYKDSTVTLTYIDKYKRPAVFKYNCGEVAVHTPVYCKSDTNTKKEFNQAVTPTNKDVVLGEEFTVAFNDFGQHRDIKGYGLGSYTKYVGLRQVCCPFSVMYNGRYYEPNQWIDIEDYNAKLTVCEENNEGCYTIYTRTVAYNGLSKLEEAYMQELANLDYTKYGAYASKEVRLIGNLHKLKIEYEDDVHYVAELPLEIVPENDKSYNMEFELVGDITDEDVVKLKYTYYHEDANGELTPVDVYGIRDRDAFNDLLSSKFMEHQEISTDGTGCIQDGNISKWITTIPLYTDHVVVPKGTELEKIEQAIKSNSLEELSFSEGSVVVCVDIVSYKKDIPHLSYINEENAAKGYCNMWLREGGTSNYPYGAVIKLKLKDYVDGEYYEYEISGTH